MNTKLLYWLSFTLFLTLILSCGSRQHEPVFYETPPNGILVKENFYCDQSEITNFNWMEYMYWTKRTFGYRSAEHLATLPDTNVWKEFDTCLVSYVDYYLPHPAYRDYPVVGVSQKQAIDFSNWRSDRVFEFLLIREEIIDYHTNQTAADYFTIEKYLA